LKIVEALEISGVDDAIGEPQPDSGFKTVSISVRKKEVSCGYLYCRSPLWSWPTVSSAASAARRRRQRFYQKIQASQRPRSSPTRYATGMSA